MRSYQLSSLGFAQPGHPVTRCLPLSPPPMPSQHWIYSSLEDVTPSLGFSPGAVTGILEMAALNAEATKILPQHLTQITSNNPPASQPWNTASAVSGVEGASPDAWKQPPFLLSRRRYSLYQEESLLETDQSWLSLFLFSSPTHFSSLITFIHSLYTYKHQLCARHCARLPSSQQSR